MGQITLGCQRTISMCLSPSIYRAFITLTVLCLLACSHTPRPEDAPSAINDGRWVKDGLIIISRQAPAPASLNPTSTMLGFIPSKQGREGNWISVNRSEGTVTLMEGEKSLQTLVVQGVERLKEGTFKILHKQKSPLWYAPDSYFMARNLPLPSQGDKSRFRRGALGEYALFLDKDTPIHSGPVWSDDVGGVRLSEQAMSKMYYSLEVGSPIEVK